MCVYRHDRSPFRKLAVMRFKTLLFKRDLINLINLALIRSAGSEMLMHVSHKDDAARLDADGFSLYSLQAIAVCFNWRVRL